MHKCILAALVEAPEKQTFSLYVDELLCDKTDVIKSVSFSLRGIITEVYRVEAIWTEKYGVAKMSDTL